MNPCAFLLAADGERSISLWFVVFVVLPLALRLLRWLGTRFGLIKPEASEGEEAGDASERLRRRRAERQAAEKKGEELWKRLARGEAVDARAPRPVPPPASAVRRTSLDDEAEEETDVPVPESLEREEEPTPLATLRESQVPEVTPAASLETEEEPTPIAALGPGGARTALSQPEQRARVRTALRFGPGDRRRAIVFSEVLGPPVSERRGG